MHFFQFCLIQGSIWIRVDLKYVHKTWQNSYRHIESEVFVSLSTASVRYIFKVTEGSNIHLPCYFPLSSQVEANALWFKETGVGRRMRLNTGDDSTGDSEKVEQLYPLDHDQTIILRQIVMEDAGTYTCESANRQKLSTVDIVVEGRFGNLFHILLMYSLCNLEPLFITVTGKPTSSKFAF